MLMKYLILKVKTLVLNNVGMKSHDWLCLINYHGKLKFLPFGIIIKSENDMCKLYFWKKNICYLINK